MYAWGGSCADTLSAEQVFAFELLILAWCFLVEHNKPNAKINGFVDAICAINLADI